MNELEQLNSLLTGGVENKRLDSLEYRLDNIKQRSQEIAQVLPDVILSLQNQNNFISALQNSVDNCVKQAMQQDPDSYINALLPAEKVILNEIAANAIKPINLNLQEQQDKFKNLTKQLHDFELAYTNQNKQIDRQKQNIDEIKQTNNQQIKKTQTVLNTQLNELEIYLDKLDKVQVNQHLQLDNLTKHIDDLNKNIQTRQNTQYRALHNKVQTAFKKLQTNIVQLSNQNEKLKQSYIDGVKECNTKNELALVKYGKLLKNIQNSQLKNFTKILPSIIQQAATDPALAESLQIPVEECIQISIKQDAGKFADALFPIMGPAIRKSINESFKAIVQRINKSLEESLSPKGLVWRLQAFRTGQSFSDIVLQNTLVFKVEQVFLIHRETGLLIQHLHQDNINVGDSDAVSAMFTAIQDFVRDSFAGDDVNDQRNLNMVEVGDRTVWLEHGPYAVLACVIRGDAPLSFRSLMQSSLESIHALYGSLLQNFSGDPQELEPCRNILQRTIQTEEKIVHTKWRSQLLRIGAVLLIILLLTGNWAYWSYLYQQRLNNYIKVLDTTPGIVVISSTNQAGKLVIYGMRDPLAEEPLQIATKFDLTAEEVVFKGTAYQDLDEQFVMQRLKRWLQAPESVKISLKNKTLYLVGHAEQDWINNVTKNIRLIAGIDRVITDKLVNVKAKFQEYLKVLKDTPGIMVVSDYVDNEKLVVTGMRDPLADSPQEIANKMHIKDIVLQLTPYQDLTQQFIEKRARLRLKPPATIKLTVDNNTLYLTGHASQVWIDKAIDNSLTVIGINKLETKKLVNTDQFLLAQVQQDLAYINNINLTIRNKILIIDGYVDDKTFQILQQKLPQLQNIASFNIDKLINAELEIIKLSQQIEKTTIYFSAGIDFLSGQEQELQQLYNDVKQLFILNDKLNKTINLQIIGNTDGVDTKEHNYQLSQNRALTMINWLSSKGIDKTKLFIMLPEKIKFGEKVSRPNFRNIRFLVKE
ncbi:hypothetical protein QUF74_10595 [Candidatus Halobeggiatoa sp. HSG11]|nr:hypothetical protein [Candidatus Halobeggiatoa sp. HSG11]